MSKPVSAASGEIENETCRESKGGRSARNKKWDAAVRTFRDARKRVLREECFRMSSLEMFNNPSLPLDVISAATAQPMRDARPCSLGCRPKRICESSFALFSA